MLLKNNLEKGFTLVSLLIVLAIIALLAAVVILSVAGIFERGSEQALDMETDVIQTAVNLFNGDDHKGVADGIWGVGPLDNHFPTEDGEPGLLTGDSFPLAVENGDFESALDGIIWMGLLANTPGNPEENSPAAARPQAGEDGPYLNEIPESSSVYNGNNSGGPYTWIVLSDGAVAAVEIQGNEWALISGGSGSRPDSSPVPPTITPSGDTYTLTIASTSGGSVLLPGEGDFIYGEGEEVLIYAAPAGCNEFVSWTGDVTTMDDPAAAESKITMDGDYTITANFERGEYVQLNIEVDSENNAWISIRDESTGSWAIDKDGVLVDGSHHQTPTSIMVPLGDYIIYVQEGAWSDEVDLPMLDAAVCEVTVTIEK